MQQQHKIEKRRRMELNLQVINTTMREFRSLSEHIQ